MIEIRVRELINIERSTGLIYRPFAVVVALYGEFSTGISKKEIRMIYTAEFQKIVDAG